MEEDIATLAHKSLNNKDSLQFIWDQCQSLIGSKKWQELKQEDNSKGLRLNIEKLGVFRDILLDVAHVRAQSQQSRPAFIWRSRQQIHESQYHDLLVGS